MKTWSLMKDSEDRAMHAGRVQEAAHVQEFVEKANIEKALVQILRKDVILLEQRSVEMASGYKQKEEALEKTQALSPPVGALEGESAAAALFSCSAAMPWSLLVHQSR